MTPASRGSLPATMADSGYVDTPDFRPCGGAGTVLRGRAAVVHLVEQFAVPSRLSNTVQAGTPHSGVRGNSG
jgi:hypothetical protein